MKKTRHVLRKILTSQEIGVIMAFLIMVTYLSIQTDTFLKPQNLSSNLLNLSWIAIAAFGQTMVIITAGIDLSVGSVMALSGLAAAYFVSGDFSPWAEQGIEVTRTGREREVMLVADQYVPLALLAGCGMGALLGAANGAFIAWGNLPPFIATLGMMGIARGICYGTTNGQPVRGLNEKFTDVGRGEYSVLGLNIPYPTIIMVVLGVIAFIFLTRLVWGYRIYAVGGNEQAAELSGINVRRTKFMVYVISGLMGGIAGTLMISRLGVADPNAANAYELNVIAAVVIGGTSLMGGKGTILGTLIGAALMQVLRNGLNLLGYNPYWQPVAIGSVIIIAIAFDQLRQDPRVRHMLNRLVSRAKSTNLATRQSLE
ncbi:MAG: ABC transporter permease [Chloroflexi bacterium]|nr:ABC transporter permease [Chloroflexota bacterium]